MNINRLHLNINVQGICVESMTRIQIRRFFGFKSKDHILSILARALNNCIQKAFISLQSHGKSACTHMVISLNFTYAFTFDCNRPGSTFISRAIEERVLTDE
jgi:hypothetical protein